MKKILIGGCLLAIVACNNASDTSTTPSDTSATTTKTDSPSTAASEWVSLFDGNSTSGWHTYGITTVASTWKVDSGALHLVPPKDKKESGDLVTNDSYENFHLKLEWKIAPKGNSGIIFLVNEDTAQYKKTYNTGPEMQVLDNNGHPDAKIIKHRAGDLYDLITSSKEVVKPAGEWNQAEVMINNGKLDLVLNGTNVVSTTLWDDNWNKMIAGSKFKDMPGFAKSHSGKIALQDHGDEVWYRNITIKKL
jgi:3-keto-disaccharide hydrolase